jgi:hypothetical protein
MPPDEPSKQTRRPKSTVRGNFTDTASLMSLKGPIADEVREPTNEIISMVKQFESLQSLNGAAKINENFLATSAAINTGLADERGRIPFYFGLTVVGISALALAGAAIAYTNIHWGARVGLGGASVALAGIEVRILNLFSKMRNRVSDDHLRFLKVSLEAKNRHDDMDRKERLALHLMHIANTRPELLGPLAEISERIFGKA